MTGPLLIDTNLLLLLIVGSADKSYITIHNRLRSDYSISDYKNLVQIIGLFDEIIILPNTLTEVSNFSRQLKEPARSKIQRTFQKFIDRTYELYIESKLGVLRDEFLEIGLTDSILLYACSLSLNGVEPTLISVDQNLLNHAHSLGLNILDYKAWRDETG